MAVEIDRKMGRETGAIFSPDRIYRYLLWRQWGEGASMVAFIGLNPSTADEVQNDPTVTRCINYAKDWGYDGMYMLNIFAYRATDPKEMMRYLAPIGLRNKHWLFKTRSMVSFAVACWGDHGRFRKQGRLVKALLQQVGPLHCFGRTKFGEPRHPLYLRRDRGLELYE